MNQIPGLIPLLSLLFAVVCVDGWRGKHVKAGWSLRESILLAWVVWLAWCVLGAEILSLGHMLNRLWVGVWWLVPSLGMLGWIIKYKPSLQGWGHGWLRPTLGQWGLLGLMGGLLGIIFLAAILTPPNNYDSLSYHLPRQIIWMQQQSVLPFSTTNIRQIMMPPLAEFVSLHMMILTQGDAWLNLIQWFALIVTMLGVSLVAKGLGASVTGQLLAAALMVMVPVSFLQASTTKNDLVLASLTMAALWWVLQLGQVKDGSISTWRVIMLGLVLGEMLLTKGAAVAWGVPIGGLLLCYLIRQEGWRRACSHLTLIGTLVVAVNTGHWLRNTQQFGNPNGPADLRDGAQIYTMGTHTPNAIASNILRNLMPSLTLPSEKANKTLFDGMVWLHQLLGIDISDQRTTFPYIRCVVPQYTQYEEDKAGAQVHLLLFLTLPLGLWLVRRQVQVRRLVLYLLLPVSGYLLFCALFRWQHWHVRLLQPLAGMLIPACAVIWTAPRLQKFSFVVGGVAFLWLVPSILYGDRPLLSEKSIFRIDPQQARYRYVPSLVQSRSRIEDLVKAIHPQTVGLLGNGDSPVYLIQQELMWNIIEPPKFTFFNSTICVDGKLDEAPDLVVGWDAFPREKLHHWASGRTYCLVAEFYPLLAYVPEEQLQDLAMKSCFPAFYGWKREIGLAAVEGPYPQWNLPHIRWGLSPETVLYFQGDGLPIDLVIEARRNSRPGQRLQINLNGKDYPSLPFGESLEFQRLITTMPTMPGENQLILKCDESGAWGPPNSSVLFKTLQIRPASAR